MGYIADTHVHLYPEFDLRAALTGAADRLAAASDPKFPSPGAVTKILCLTERESESYFESFAGTGFAGGLPASATGEIASLRISLPFDEELFLIAGRQIVTDERLEVLVLGTVDRPPSPLSLEAAVEWAGSRGAFPVLPWSFGKWVGKRGRELVRFLEDGPPAPFALGDIHMRPDLIPSPRQMKRARRKGTLIVSGSDPLPLAGEESLIGGTFIWGKQEISPGEPWACLKKIFIDEPETVNRGGAHGGGADLVRRWLTYRVKKSSSTSTVPSKTC